MFLNEYVYFCLFVNNTHIFYVYYLMWLHIQTLSQAIVKVVIPTERYIFFLYYYSYDLENIPLQNYKELVGCLEELIGASLSNSLLPDSSSSYSCAPCTSFPGKLLGILTRISQSAALFVLWIILEPRRTQLSWNNTRGFWGSFSFSIFVSQSHKWIKREWGI